MHKFSTPATKSSGVLHPLCDPQAGAPLDLLSASFHRYGAVCGKRDGVEFTKRRGRDGSDIVEEERKKLMPSRRHPPG